MNKESVIIKLVEVYKDDEGMLFMISNTLKSCSKYVDLINQQEILVTVDKYALSKEVLLERIKSLDNQRRATHNGIISGLKLINRLCDSNNIDKFYSGDEEDRYQVADFAMELTNNAFVNRKK